MAKEQNRTAPFWGVSPGHTSNTVWSGPKPTTMPTFILIDPTICPQYTNVTDRTGQADQTDNGPMG